MDLNLAVNDDEAWDLAQLVKRLCSRNLGEADGLGLVTDAEKAGAETALHALKAALAEAGFAPR